MGPPLIPPPPPPGTPLLGLGTPKPTWPGDEECQAPTGTLRDAWGWCCRVGGRKCLSVGVPGSAGTPGPRGQSRHPGRRAGVWRWRSRPHPCACCAELAPILPPHAGLCRTMPVVPGCAKLRHIGGARLRRAVPCWWCRAVASCAVPAMPRGAGGAGLRGPRRCSSAAACRAGCHG